MLFSLASALAFKRNEGNSRKVKPSLLPEYQLSAADLHGSNTKPAAAQPVLSLSVLPGPRALKWPMHMEQLLDICQPLPALKGLTYTRKLRCCRMTSTH